MHIPLETSGLFTCQLSRQRPSSQSQKQHCKIWTKIIRYKKRYNNRKYCYKVTPYEQIGSFLPDEYRPYYMIISIFSVLFLIVISRLINRYDNLFDRYFIGFSFSLLWLNLRKKQTLSKKQIKALMERKEFLQNSIKNKKVNDNITIDKSL